MVRRLGFWRLGVALATLMVVGCDDGGDDTGDTGLEADVLVRGEDDMGPDEGPAPDTGPVADDGVEVDMMPDEGIVRQLDGCEDICAVYEDCDRLDLWAGSVDECRRGCDDATLSDRFQSYENCVAITSCGNLDECVVPPRPRPACAEVCEVLDACGASARIPDGLPNVANCAAACNDRLFEQTIVDCGEAAVYEPEQCTEEIFATCFAETRQNDCLTFCRARDNCEEGFDVIGCVVECAQPLDTDDPVAQRRRNITRTCAREARDCAELEACGRQTARPIVGEATIAEMCAANEGCGFLADTCVADAPGLLRQLADNAIDCLTATFTDTCEDGPLRCFVPNSFPVETCDEYCANAALCGRLPDGQIELECVQQCRATLESGEPSAIEPLRAQLSCAYQATCDEIATCEADAGTVDCGAYCARRDECELGGPEDCVADCEARASTARGFAERSCTLTASTCEAAAGCVAPPPPPCDLLCAPLDACALGGPDCVRACDDADFEDPAGFVPTLACVTSTERCDGRSICLDGDLSGGTACLAWCRREVECGESEQTMVECVVECGEGFAGAEGLTFDGARECLEAEGANAECEALDACVDAVPADGYCARFCGVVAGCLLTDDEAACLADCSAAPDDAERVDQAACTLDADRSGAGCAVVAECLGVEVEPASPACMDLCAAQNACDEDVDVFLCERACIPEPDGTPVRAACAGRAGCDQLQLCLDAPGEIPAACADVCATLSMCAGQIGEGDGARYLDAEACAADCGGATILSEAEDYPGDLATCLDAAMCDADAITACYEAGPSGGCADAYAAYVTCGNDWIPALGGAADEASYVMLCEQALAMDRMATQMQIDCVIGAAEMSMVDPNACLGQLGCVLPF